MYLPQNSIVVAGPVIVEEINGKRCVLLNKHKETADKPSPKWQFCGGTMEDFDSNLEETAKREVKEEMGIEIEIEKLLHVCLGKKSDGGIAILVHYLAKRIGEIKIGDDIAEYNWFSIDELPVDVQPNVKEVIKLI